MAASKRRSGAKKLPKSDVGRPEKITARKSEASKTEVDEFRSESIWVPSGYVALKALVSARLCAAIWSILNDCDETYNYWEPTHFLLFGKGFQTWEYSPTYALRSYAYLMVHAAPAFIYSRLQEPNRMLVFFFIRCILSLISSLCELYFYKGICKAFGGNVARVTLGVSLFCAGMFIASAAFLPSSFAMYMTMLSYGAWFHGSLQLAIFSTALSAFLGWPFAALLGVPIAFDILVLKRKIWLFLKWCFISAFTILVPMVQYDSVLFGRLVVAPLNLVLYNVFSSRGPDLYGTAPASYYLVNGLLNFNVLVPIALAAPLLYGICVYASLTTPGWKTSSAVWLSSGGLFLWLAVFVLQPHKEERFLFPIYPLVCLWAAMGIDAVQRIFSSVFVKKRTRHYLEKTNWIAVIVIAVSSIVSLSRIVGQYQGYRAPFDTFLELQRMEHDGEVPRSLRTVNVCYGREWHRFPSSFFLPSPRWDVKFIESEFRGQLPAAFGVGVANATTVIPPHMNDLNQEETSRYVPLSSCHFLIDVDREEETKREPRYSLKEAQWQVVHRVPFLDAQKSPPLFRAFFVPFATQNYCSYVDYVILRAKNLNKKRI